MIHPLHRNINNKETIIKAEGPASVTPVSSHKVSDVAIRVLHDFAIDDVITRLFIAIVVYPVPLKVQHYQWHDLAHKQIVAAAGFEECDREDGAAKGAKEFSENYGGHVWRHNFNVLESTE